MKRLAVLLGRLPTKADVELFSDFRLDQFERAFATWSEAVKAAKIAVPAGASAIATGIDPGGPDGVLPIRVGE